MATELEQLLDDVVDSLNNKVSSPQTAEVGQIIVVSDVDKNGKPTEWEATDLPSSGASAFSKTPQFDIVVEESVPVLKCDMLDGVPLDTFGFTKLYTLVWTTAQEEKTGSEFLLCVNSDTVHGEVTHPRASAGTSFMGQTSAKCWHAYYDLPAGLVQFSPSGSTNSGWSVAVNTVTDTSNLFGKTVANFKFVSNAGILAGTKIKVWLA